jgi:uncharacterized protein
MKILVTGASGLIGSALVATLRAENHAVVRLRRPGVSLEAGDARWDPSSGEADLAAMESADAVVNLAGASIAAGRWNAARKQLLRSSRVDTTRHLVASLARLPVPPRALVSASAIGYYGDRGDEQLTETSPPGHDFLAELARDWEAAALEAERSSMRVVVVRFGVVLAKHGGALPRMLTPFKMGVGGRLGTGKQWMSWVVLNDVVSMIRFAAQNEKLSGPLNAVAPIPVRNAEFTRILARVLHRPAVFPAPGFALRLALGEMADALLLSSQRVISEKFSEAGFVFRQSQLDSALRSVLA